MALARLFPWLCRGPSTSAAGGHSRLATTLSQDVSIAFNTVPLRQVEPSLHEECVKEARNRDSEECELKPSTSRATGRISLWQESEECEIDSHIRRKTKVHIPTRTVTNQVILPLDKSLSYCAMCLGFLLCTNF